MLAYSQYFDILISISPFVLDPFFIIQVRLKSVISFDEARFSFAASALFCINDIHLVQILGKGVHNLLQIFN